MIFEIDKSGEKEPERLKSSTLKDQGWNELDLQKYLFENLEHFIGKDLFVIAQSKKWREEPDLIALDKFGDLWIFELKAIAGYSDNLLQVLRYSQIHGAFDIDHLDHIYRRHHPKSDSLLSDFTRNFAYTSPSSVAEWTPRVAKKHHLVVVVNQTDGETLTAIEHWQNQGLDIRVWLYEVYPGDDAKFRIDLPDLYHRGIKISSSSSQVFLVNTDRRYNAESEPYMLKHHRALATSPDYMPKINRLATGSRVLLYRSGEGIIAGGTATAEKKNDFLGEKPIRYVQLKDFFLLETSIKPAESKALFNQNLPVIGTISAISNAVADRVWDEALKRRKLSDT